MILLVPLNPEVPALLKPKVWPSIFMVLCLCLGYFSTRDTVVEDWKFVESVDTTTIKKKSGMVQLEETAENHLALRPLLSIAPAQGDWDIGRLLKANFIHGSLSHLILNSIGVFAGIRICMTFVPLLTAFLIFLIGGSLGLWVSLFTSQQISKFIPHVGASAGLFALMGTYYVFNFKFRTQYFFWLPIRRGFVSLRTSWFFFVDVLLLELVLSAAQLFPERVDSVDHIAHVVGFSSGMILALTLRLFLKWPGFLQTRAEYIYWVHFIKKNNGLRQRKIQSWLELLRLNRYNDFLKLRLCHALRKTTHSVTDTDLNEIFKFFVPTFVRLNTTPVATVIGNLISENRQVPGRWLAKVPYDIVIRISKALANHPRHEYYLYRLLADYKKAQEKKGKSHSTVEKLMARLESRYGKLEDRSSQRTG